MDKLQFIVLMFSNTSSTVVSATSSDVLFSDYDYVYTPVQSVNYCDRLGRCFRFVCIYACTAAFLCCCRFSVNKDLYILLWTVMFFYIWRFVCMAVLQAAAAYLM